MGLGIDQVAIVSIQRIRRVPDSQRVFRQVPRGDRIVAIIDRAVMRRQIPVQEVKPPLYTVPSGRAKTASNPITCAMPGPPSNPRSCPAAQTDNK